MMSLEDLALLMKADSRTISFSRTAELMRRGDRGEVNREGDQMSTPMFDVGK
jgi:hypothetical protein